MTNNPPPTFSWDCLKPFTPCWCESHKYLNHPKCRAQPDAAPLDNPYFILIMIVAGIVLILIKLKIINMKNLFNKVSTFLWGEKSFRWGELKGL